MSDYAAYVLARAIVKAAWLIAKGLGHRGIADTRTDWFELSQLPKPNGADHDA